MSIRSLLNIQNPGLSGLGAYSLQPYVEGSDPNIKYSDVGQIVNQALTGQQGSLTPSTPSTIVTQTPEEAVALSRRVAFLQGSRPGYDYGSKSSDRNSLYARDTGGLGFDVFSSLVASVKESAPAAFKGVNASAIKIGNLPGSGLKLPPALASLKLPSWLPKIRVAKPLQKAVATVAQKAVADLQKQRAASNSGVASQTIPDPSITFGSPTPANSKMNPWIVGGAAFLILGGVVAFSKRGRR